MRIARSFKIRAEKFFKGVKLHLVRLRIFKDYGRIGAGGVFKKSVIKAIGLLIGEN